MSANIPTEWLESPMLVGLLKSTLLFAATLAALRLMGTCAARQRHALAVGGLLLAASVPLLAWGGPSIAFRLPHSVHSSPTGVTPALAAAPGIGPATTEGGLSAGTDHAIGMGSEPRPELAAGLPGRALDGLALLWTFGALWCLCRRIRDWTRTRALTDEAGRAPTLEHVARRVSAGWGLAALEVRTHPEVRVPFTWGLWRTRIVLPEEALGWSRGQVHAVLLHELSHARRRDYWAHWAIELVRAAFWFHPLARWLAQRASAECEHACDEAVLEAGVPPLDYASTLLAVARDARATQPQGRRGLDAPPSVLAAAHPRGLAHRVERILADPDLRVGGERRRTMHGLGGVILALTLVTAPLRPLAGGLPGALPEHELRERQRSAWSLGEREDSGAVSELLSALDDASPRMRAIAAWALGEIKDVGALPALYLRLEDADPYVREMALRAIGEHECACSLDVILAQLASGAPHMRVAAVAALAEIRAPAAFASILSALEDPEASVRTEALERLAELELARAPAAVWTALEDPTASVRAAACRLLGALCSLDAVDPLLQALWDPDPSVRAAATWALDEVNLSRP